NLFLKLPRKARGDLQVLGGSGALYRFSLVPAEGSYDGHVRILAGKEEKRVVPEPVEMSRAMGVGRRPAEGNVLKADHSLGLTPELAAKVLYVYETGAYRGYVVRVENTSAAPQRLDPSRFVSKELVLAGAR